MNSFQLFRHRMVRDWKLQIRNFRSIADWTIWLYLIIPGIVISIFIYRSWWIEGAPEWFQWLPLGVFFFIGYLSAWNGSYRTYLDEADKVFLVKKRQLFLGLKQWGFRYSLLYQAVLTVLTVVFFLPFFIVHYQLSWSYVIIYFLFLLALKYLIMYLKFHIKRIDRKIVRVIINIITFIILSWLTQLISIPWMNGDLWLVLILSIIIGTASVMLYYPLIEKNSLFDVELSIESEEKLKLVNAIFLMSNDIEKTKIISRKKPWLFRNSMLILKKRTAKNGFIELFIKVFIRNSMYVMTYFQISSVTVAALIIVPPLWIKLIIFVGFLFMMWIWLVGIWERVVLTHPFMKKYQESDAYFSAKKWTMTSLLIFSILIVCIMAGIGWFVVSQVSSSLGYLL